MQITKQQSVKQFNDEDDFHVKQEVTIDTEGGEIWIVIEHNNNDLSMSLDNWYQLKELVEKTILINEKVNHINIIKKLTILIWFTLFSCSEDIKLDTIDNHKNSVLLHKYHYGSLTTSVLVLKKKGAIYSIKCYNSEVNNLKIKDSIK